jgi:hypothetical protein
MGLWGLINPTRNEQEWHNRVAVEDIYGPLPRVARSSQPL